MSLHSPENQAARANCSLAILFFAPFNESEQFGLHVQKTKLLSKPVSPIVWLCVVSVRQGSANEFQD
jgi:hypothetical protein